MNKHYVATGFDGGKLLAELEAPFTPDQGDDPKWVNMRFMVTGIYPTTRKVVTIKNCRAYYHTSDLINNPEKAVLAFVSAKTGALILGTSLIKITGFSNIL